MSTNSNIDQNVQSNMAPDSEVDDIANGMATGAANVSIQEHDLSVSRLITADGLFKMPQAGVAADEVIAWVKDFVREAPTDLAAADTPCANTRKDEHAANEAPGNAHDYCQRVTQALHDENRALKQEQVAVRSRSRAAEARHRRRTRRMEEVAKFLSGGMGLVEETQGPDAHKLQI
ncbi:hypothetical protein VTJ49DRAFT_3520 [Mycothermus thermophilus]|uniref:Uncharacterized protein n=1 Tax=Humicola insolens TaxID=85995 RepID=A0ABR3V7Q6_HUMIN